MIKGYQQTINTELTFTCFTKQALENIQKFLNSYNSKHICNIIQYDNNKYFVESCDGEVDACYFQNGKFYYIQQDKLLDIKPAFKYSWMDGKYHNENGVVVTF